MTTFSRHAVRWAIAYLLLINSVDTLANTLSVNHAALTSSWINPLLAVSTLLTIAGSVLLAFGWRLRDNALALAACTSLFALVYAEPIAIFITVGLLMLAHDANNRVVTREEPARRDDIGNANSISNQTESATHINNCRTCSY